MTNASNAIYNNNKAMTNASNAMYNNKNNDNNNNELERWLAKSIVNLSVVVSRHVGDRSRQHECNM
mgnify:CR=1 FL=1